MSTHVLRQGVSIPNAPGELRQTILPAGTPRTQVPAPWSEQDGRFTTDLAFQCAGPTGPPAPSLAELAEMDPTERTRWETPTLVTGPPDPNAPTTAEAAAEAAVGWDDRRVGDVRAFIRDQGLADPGKDAVKSALVAVVEAAGFGPADVPRID